MSIEYYNGNAREIDIITENKIIRIIKTIEGEIKIIEKF